MTLTNQQKDVFSALDQMGRVGQMAKVLYARLWGVCPTCGSSEIVQFHDEPTLCRCCDGVEEGEEEDGNTDL